jgi:hypothetical protein
MSFTEFRGSVLADAEVAALAVAKARREDHIENFYAGTDLGFYSEIVDVAEATRVAADQQLKFDLLMEEKARRQAMNPLDIALVSELSTKMDSAESLLDQNMTSLLLLENALTTDQKAALSTLYLEAITALAPPSPPTPTEPCPSPCRGVYCTPVYLRRRIRQ